MLTASVKKGELKLKKKAMKVLAKKCIKKIKAVLDAAEVDEIEITIDTKYALSFHRHESSYGTFFSQQFVAVANVDENHSFVDIHRNTAHVDGNATYSSCVLSLKESDFEDKINEDFVMDYPSDMKQQEEDDPEI
jgi:hypothetical protein